jgi:hypothetical protein
MLAQPPIGIRMEEGNLFSLIEKQAIPVITSCQ